MRPQNHDRPFRLTGVRSFAPLGALVLLAAGPSAAGESVVYEDDFSAGLADWGVWSNTSSTEPHTYGATADPDVGAPAPGAHIEGDWDTDDTDGPDGQGRQFGLQRTYPSLLRFHLAFDWRAWSSNITTTNATLQVVRASDDSVLYSQPLIGGSVLDTGWLAYPPTDLSFALPGDPTDVHVRLLLNDGWHADHNQHLAFDNVQLITTELPPVPEVPVEVDDFDASTDPWTHWRDSDAFSPTYALVHDAAEGAPAPAAQVQGSYEYSGSTRRYGLQRTVGVTLPFVVEFDYATLDAAAVTFQLLETDGTLRHTVQLPVPDAAWQHHDPVDLTANVAGLDEAVVRFWIVGTDHDNPDNAVWIDNVSWTAPCLVPGLFYEDGDGDGFGDPDAPHPDGGDTYCYAPGGYADDATDCDDDDPAAFPGAEEDCDTPADEDCDDSEVDGLDIDCPPPGDDDDATDEDDATDDDDAGDDDDSSTGDDDQDGGGPSGQGACRCDAGTSPAEAAALLVVLGLVGVRRRTPGGAPSSRPG